FRTPIKGNVLCINAKHSANINAKCPSSGIIIFSHSSSTPQPLPGAYIFHHVLPTPDRLQTCLLNLIFPVPRCLVPRETNQAKSLGNAPSNPVSDQLIQK